MTGQTEAFAALDWWREAGVDTLVEEEPRDWLKAPAKPQPAATPAPFPAPFGLPEDLQAFRDWLAESDSLPGAPGARLLPTGDPAAGLMLLADMPEAADTETGMLVSGEAGRLLDRMLGAIGRDRASVYLAAMSGVRLSARELEAPKLVEAARRHAALAAPRLLLLLGDAPSRGLLGMGFAEARGRTHSVNLDGTTVNAIATFHPRFLLQRPALKAAAWADLRRALKELGQ